MLSVPSAPSISLSAPADAVALVPYLLGFHPANNSFVVIGGDSAGKSIAFRWDLTDALQHEKLVRQLYSVLIRQRTDWVILLGYGAQTDTVPLLQVAQEALESVLTIKDVLCVEGERWRSLMCRKPGCCPPEGTPIDSAATIAAAQATYAGLSPYGSREEVAQSIAAVEGEDLMWMQAETERAEAELRPVGWRGGHRSMERVAMAHQLIGQQRTLTDREAASLSVLLTNLRVRDSALVLMPERDIARQVKLWRDLTRRAVGRYAAGPAALLAVAALLSGDGLLASIAVDRCRSADPSYRLIGLIESLLAENASPEQTRVMLSVSKDLATVYQDL